jgi:uncharacterized membrane protein
LAAPPWETYLKRWLGAGLIEPATAERIRAYEAAQRPPSGSRWPVLLAISLGGLLLGAGVLLFVAAHWDTLSPSTRFGLVLFLVALFHVAAAVAAGRFPALSTALHAVGTIALGAGIFLAGQVFHLQEHWPGGAMLWAIGAWIAWAFLRDWPQAALVALLTPMWLSGEWLEATRGWIGSQQILTAGLLLLAITYLTALLPDKETPTRKALAWIGGLAIIPCATAVIVFEAWGSAGAVPALYQVSGWAMALLVPLLVAWWLRGGAAWMNIIAAFWVVALSTTSLSYFPSEKPAWRDLGQYGVCTLGAIGLITWGLKEARKERINLGVAAFALTLVGFYFSSVMDRLGRAASLIGLGLLFLLGGWLLEKARRRLVAQLDKGKA